MIWLRRVVAIILAGLFLLIFTPILIIFRINDTLANPRFYNDILRQSGTYTFLLNQAIPAAVAEIKPEGDNPESTAFLTSLKPHITSIVKETFPAEWIQAQTEQSINSIVPYMTGDTDSFRVNIAVRERMVAGLNVIKNTLHKEGVFNGVYDQFLNATAEQMAANATNLPLGPEDVKRLLQTAAPPSWCLAQIDGMVNEVSPYLENQKEHFVIRLWIAEQMDALEPVAVEILNRPAAYDFVIDKLVVPAVRQKLSAVPVASLPGLSFNDADINTVVRTVVTLEWYRVRVNETAKPLFSYLKGTQTTLAVVIPLADRKPLATAALSDLVNKKTGLPLTIVTPFVNTLVNTLIPNQWTLDENAIKQLLGTAGGQSVLVQAKDWVQNGFTYTDGDLRDSLGSDYIIFENIRRTGSYTITERDLRGLIAGADTAQGAEALKNFDNVRNQVGTARRLLPLAWIILVGLLLSIGFLGGISWPGKLIWSASVLVIASIGAFLICGPVFTGVIKPQIERGLLPIGGTVQNAESLITGKAIEIILNGVNSFVSGLMIETLIMLAVAILAVVGGIIWMKNSSGS